MGKAKDLTGQRFVRLVVVAPTEKRSGGNVVWECRCDCGNIKLVPGGHLTSGAVKSCGCLRKKKHEENKEELSGEKSRKVRNLEYPLNLWSVVLERPISTEELPEDWEPALDHVLSTLGSDKKKEIVLNRYKDKLTLAAIGDLYGLSWQAVGQSIGRTIDKLRQPDRKVFFLYGWERGLESSESKPLDVKRQTIRAIKPSHLTSCHAIGPIDLSVRPFNCLMNSGIDTIDKLLQCTEEDLYNMRNMGELCVNEIKAKLALSGLSLHEPKAVHAGERFGILTVVAPTEERKHGNVIWECLCDCGNTKLVSGYRLTTGEAVDCGFCHRKRGRGEDLTGQRFGRLTAIRPTEKRLRGNVVWECRCDCGERVEVVGIRLVQMQKKATDGCPVCRGKEER